MNTYRIYVLDRRERIAVAREVRFAADRDALDYARRIRSGYAAAEVWEGERLVARLGAEFRIPA